MNWMTSLSPINLITEKIWFRRFMILSGSVQERIMSQRMFLHLNLSSGFNQNSFIHYLLIFKHVIYKSSSLYYWHFHVKLEVCCYLGGKQMGHCVCVYIYVCVCERPQWTLTQFKALGFWIVGLLRSEYVSVKEVFICFFCIVTQLKSMGDSSNY